MKVSMKDKLVVAISSRALFDLNACHKIYEEQGIEAYREYQKENEHNILKPGSAYHLVEKFLKINQGRKADDTLVEVILLSKNSADTGLRVFNSIEHYGLNISRAAFCSGESPYTYAQAFDAHLFLSLDDADVSQALASGCAAARILDTGKRTEADTELRIAFDGDAVLFSDESELYFQKEGLAAFNENEKAQANRPLAPGPFSQFLRVLHRLQQVENLPISIRTALVTARQAPAHERVINTLRSWNIRIDESLFLGGMDKRSFLKAFQADIFFDDQHGNCDSVSQEVTSAHVSYGVKNL
tara:strand:- start:12102 stop:13001 length:900 start_codon:yes stop_codon:yes gene_type:complete